jgi:predicted exporter
MGLEEALATHIDRLITAGRAPKLLAEERIVADDGEALLVIARAARSTVGEEGREFITETMDGARAAMEYARRRVPGVRVRVTGPLPQQEAEEAVIRGDFQRTGRIAALLITLVLCVILRLWVAPLLALVPMALALAWTLGVVTVTIGRLNAFSVMFVAIVLGLGIDFGIHLIVRYEEERERGGTSDQSIRQAISATGRAVTTGAISTVVAFGALIFSIYPAFSELGWVAAIGIGFAFIAFLTVMPAMLLLKDRLLERVAPKLAPHPLGLRWLDRLGRGIERRPWRWAVGLGGITAAALLLALEVPLGAEGGWLRRGLRFQGDLLVAQPATPVHGLQQEIIRRFDMGSEPFYFSAPDMATTRAWTDTLLALEEEGVLARVVSPARMVPPDLRQRVAAGSELRQRLREIAERAPTVAGGDGEATVVERGEGGGGDAALAEAMRRLAGLTEEVGDLAYLAGLDSLPRCTPLLAGQIRRQAVAVTRRSGGAAPDEELSRVLRGVLAQRRAEIADPAQGRVFDVADLPATLRAQMVGRSGRLLISAYGRQNIYDDNVNGALVRRLREQFPKVAGVPVLYSDLLGLSRVEGIRSSRLAFLLVFLAIWVDLKRLRHTITTMVPLVVGTIWTLGAMRLLGLEFNFANVVAAPLLLGIGIDDGVHLMHRRLEEGRGGMGRVLHRTGRAVLLTSLTTMIGFGVFELAHHRGLESLGRVMVLGVGACFLASITAFPTLIALEERWRRRKAPESAAM